MSEKKIRDQFADTMLEVGQLDQNLVILVGDISHFRLLPFAKKCPGRYYNVGICEAAIVSMAAGLSKLGFHPVVHSIASFIIERAFEQIKLDFCYQKLPGNIITVGSAFDYSNLGCTHHCYDDFVLLKSLPNVQVLYPGSCLEFDILFKQTYKNEYLTLFRIPEHSHGQDFNPSEIQCGKGIKVTAGDNLTLIATGPQLRNALEARNELAHIGWDAEILYIHTIHPLDKDLIRTSVAKTKHALIVEEHMQNGGLGDSVLFATRDIAGVQYSFLSIPNTFITEYGSYQDHCERLGLTSRGILKRIEDDFGVSTVSHGKRS